jgi:PilZ domain
MQPAKIVIGTKTMLHCEVRDISTGGAKISIRGHVPLPETFELFICAQDLRVYPVRLRWRQGNFAGVSFGIDEVIDASAEPMAEFEAAPASFPVLVRSNTMIEKPPEMRLLGYQGQVRNALVVADDRTLTSVKSTRASVQAGRCGWERRRRNLRRSAF